MAPFLWRNSNENEDTVSHLWLGEEKTTSPEDFTSKDYERRSQNRSKTGRQKKACFSFGFCRKTEKQQKTVNLRFWLRVLPSHSDKTLLPFRNRRITGVTGFCRRDILERQTETAELLGLRGFADGTFSNDRINTGRTGFVVDREGRFCRSLLYCYPIPPEGAGKGGSSK